MALSIVGYLGQRLCEGRHLQLRFPSGCVYFCTCPVINMRPTLSLAEITSATGDSKGCAHLVPLKQLCRHLLRRPSLSHLLQSAASQTMWHCGIRFLHCCRLTKPCVEGDGGGRAWGLWSRWRHSVCWWAKLQLPTSGIGPAFRNAINAGGRNRYNKEAGRKEMSCCVAELLSS